MERKKVILLCDKCLSRNYSIFKSANSDTKLSLRKYCSKCNAHTTHEETR